jgi:hypothetical protein
VNAILPKMGIDQNTKRELVFGKMKYGGLDLTYLAAVQGYRQLYYLLGNLRSDDTSGTLYQILMDSYDFDKYEKNILTPNLITECWRLLKQCETTIETTRTWKPLRGRRGDVALMKVFANKKFTAKEMKDITRSEKVRI